MYLGIRNSFFTRMITNPRNQVKRKFCCLNLSAKGTVLFGDGKADIEYVKVQEHPRSQKQLHYGISPI
jgi:hypothetical protein